MGQRSLVLKPKTKYLRTKGTDLAIFCVFFVLKHACGAFRVQPSARNASTKCYVLCALTTILKKNSPAAGILFGYLNIECSRVSKRKHTKPELLELCFKSWPRAEEIYFYGNW